MLQQLLDNQIYPALYAVLDRLLPEFELQQHAKFWQSTNNLKADGTLGSAKGRVYIYQNAPFGLQDYTRGFHSLWAYLRVARQLDNAGVLHLLADVAGVPIPKSGLSQEDLAALFDRQQRAAALEVLNNLFLDAFHTQTTPKGKLVRDYVASRGFMPFHLRQSGHTIASNLAAYTGDSVKSLTEDAVDITLNFAEFGLVVDKSEAEAALKDAQSNGLLGGQFDNQIIDKVLADVYNSRTIGTLHLLSIPFRDGAGKPQGFVIRVVDDAALKVNSDQISAQSEAQNRTPKYLYSSNLERSGMLFNMHQLRTDGIAGKGVLLTEGAIDAYAATAAGIGNAVAVGGSSLLDTQLKLLLRRCVDSFTFGFDADVAGQDGAQKTQQLLNQQTQSSGKWYTTYSYNFPDGCKDIADVYAAFGNAGVRQANREATLYWVTQLNNLLARYRGLVFNDKLRTQLIEEALLQAQSLQHPVDRDSFYKLFMETADSLHITKDSFEQAADQLRYNAEQQRAGKALEQSLSRAQQLAKDGNYQQAQATIAAYQQQLYTKGNIADFEKLLITASEATLADKIRTKPESLVTGYQLLDSAGIKHALRIPAGALTIVPARTSHGKTTMALNLLLNMAQWYPNRTFHFFSYEEDSSAIILKLMNIYINQDFRNGSNLSYIEGYYKTGGASYHNSAFLEGRASFFSTLIDTGRIKIHYAPFEAEGLSRAINFLHKKEALGAVFIDYIQMLKIPGNYNSRQLELQAICNKLLIDVAVPTGIPLILGAQFNREVQTEGDMDSSKIREAGDIEQTANLILSLWNRGFKGSREGNRDRNNNVVETDPNAMYVEILKNRDGLVGLSAVLDFNGQTGKIQNKAYVNPFGQTSTHSFGK